MRVRDTEARKQRAAEAAAEQVQIDADAKVKRDARKATLKAAIERRAIYEEARAGLPRSQWRSRAPQVELQDGDEALLAEINQDLLNELTPASAQAEEDEKARADAYAARSKQVAAQFTEETPEYHKCNSNFNALTTYMSEKGLQFDSIDSYREAYTELRGQLQPVPKPQVKQEPIIDKISGAEISPYEVEMMSSDEYATRVLGKTTVYARSKMNFADMFRR
jgi:hypothetical protein